MCVQVSRVCNRNLDFNRIPSWPDCYDASDEPPLVNGTRDYIQGCPAVGPGPFANEICFDASGWQDSQNVTCDE